MEKIVSELKQVIPFKDTTDVGDIVLIATKEPQMLVYALVDSIERDSSRKDEWWVIGLTLLSIPPQKMSWTLRTLQMTGMEVFTMGGEERFIKAVDFKKTAMPTAPAKNIKDEKKKQSFIKRVK